MSESNAFFHLYAKTLDLQAQFCSRETREVLTSLKAFNESHEILEVGCGSGAQIGILSDLITNKKYLGIDVTPDLLAIAQSCFASSSNVTLQIQDVLSFEPGRRFPFMLSFAVLQHLPNTKAALEKYASLLKPHGVVAIYDSNSKDEFQSAPDLPLLRALYRTLSEENTDGKRKSHCLGEAVQLAPQLGFRFVSEKQSDHIANDQKSRDLFVEYVTHVASVVEIKYRSRVNKQELKRELEQWRLDPSGWVKLTGGSWLILEKV